MAALPDATVPAAPEPGGVIRALRTLDLWVYGGEKAVLCVVLAAMIAIVFTDFALRETGNQGLAWAKAAATYAMVWVGFLGASLATRERKHLKVDASEKLVPLRFRPHARVFVGAVAGGFCFTLAWLGWDLVAQSMRQGTGSPVMNVKLWVVQAAIPCSAVLMGMRFLLRDAGGAIREILRPASAPAAEVAP